MLDKYLKGLLRSPDANEGEESSTPQGEPQQAEKDANAEESSASEESNEGEGKTLADIVRETAEASVEKEESQETTDEESEKKEEGSVQEQDKTEEGKTEEVEEDTPSKDDGGEPPFHEHPRWKELVTERDSIRSELEAAKPLVQRATALQDFMTNAGISTQDFQAALEVLALINIDPGKAREKLRPLWEACERYTGDILPEDLIAEVEAGTISTERAREIANLRMQAATREKRSEFDARNSAVAQQQQVVKSISDWESSKAKADPDFIPKKNGEPDGLHEFVTDRFLKLVQAEKQPMTPQVGIQLAERAYSEVKKALGRFTIAPSKKSPLSSTKSSITQTKPKEPGSLKELVFQTAARHRG